MSIGNEPAYPRPSTPGTYAFSQSGLTKRELAAIEMAKGLLANPNHRPGDCTRDSEEAFYRLVAYKAAKFADAILAELEKTP